MFSVNYNYSHNNSVGILDILVKHIPLCILTILDKMIVPLEEFNQTLYYVGIPCVALLTSSIIIGFLVLRMRGQASLCEVLMCKTSAFLRL